ncbi:hypothetical protein, partial [Corallococcus praedator]|uniref:hypothetical protein n=1 Tax=Corallococcus praedator TaxID=2316724 RepID=UPI00131564EE
QHIAEQRSGEPDLLLLFESGSKYTVQITAKESNSKFVDSKKAGDVIPQSARYSPDGFICIGRPDFESLAKEQAGHLGTTFNYKQIPLYILVEIFVQTREGRLSDEQAERLIIAERGYFSFDRIKGGRE